MTTRITQKLLRWKRDLEGKSVYDTSTYDGLERKEKNNEQRVLRESPRSLSDLFQKHEQRCKWQSTEEKFGKETWTKAFTDPLPVTARKVKSLPNFKAPQRDFDGNSSADHSSVNTPESSWIDRTPDVSRDPSRAPSRESSPLQFRVALTATLRENIPE